MHQQIKYPYFNPNPATQGECCACREPPAQVQHCADMHSRNQNLCGQANTTKYWEPACFITLRLMGTRPRSSHLSRKSYSTYLFFFFSFAFTGLFTPMNCLEPVSLLFFKESVRVDVHMQCLLQKPHTSTISQNPNIFVAYRMVKIKQF